MLKYSADDMRTRLIAGRKALKLSQHELARATGITQTSISAYEKGQNKPSYENLVILADTFGVTIDYLLTGANEETLSLAGLSEADKHVLLLMRQRLRRSQ